MDKKSQYENYEHALMSVATKSSIGMADILSRWFSGHPLTDEQVGDILRQLNEILSADECEVFFGFYGIGGKRKQTLREIDDAMGWPIGVVSRVLNNAMQSLVKPKNLCRLCYIALGEREFGRQMVMAELRLSAMQTVFRSVSDHDISGHSIAAELPASVCVKLANAGMLTMEDVSYAGVRNNLVQILSLTDRDIISDALDRLGLEDHIQEGLILGRDDEALKFTVKETDCSAKIFFHPGDFCPDREAILEEIKSLASRGLCTGGVYENLRNGEVKLWFNPLVQSCNMRRTAISEMKKAIMQPNSAATLTAGADTDVLTAGE